MTVAELIAALEKMPQEAVVCVPRADDLSIMIEIAQYAGYDTITMYGTDNEPAETKAACIFAKKPD